MFAPAYSGFPVDLAGVGELHAAFLNEGRTRGCWWRPVQEIRIHGPKRRAQPHPTLLLREQKTTTKSKNPGVLSESIGKIRIRPMYAEANMGHPSRTKDRGWEIKCATASDLIWTAWVKIAHHAALGVPRGPEGRSLNVSPARKGWVELVRTGQMVDRTDRGQG